MWVIKIQMDSKNFYLGQMAMKHKVSMTGYPLTYYKDKKFLYLNVAGLIIGEDKNKKQLIKDFKSNENTVKVEINNDFMMATTKQPLATEIAYDPRIIRINPHIISKEGDHIWELASWNKDILMKVFKMCKKHYNGKILKLKQEKLKNISIVQALPDLTEKQKKAFDIAIDNGYYNFPKKINMEKLAKKMGISYSTYQEHLKRAEAHLLQFMHKRM